MEEVKSTCKKKRDANGRFVSTVRMENEALKCKVNSLTDRINALENELRELINNNAKLGNRVEKMTKFERVLYGKIGYFAKRVYNKLYYEYFD